MCVRACVPSLPTSISAQLRRNRFYFNEKVGGSRDGGSRKEKAKSTWKLESSIWGPRRKGVDSNAYWDTEEVGIRRV